MARPKKNRLRKEILYLRTMTDKSLSEIAEAVGLEKRQHVYYYLKTKDELFTDDHGEGHNKETDT